MKELEADQEYSSLNEQLRANRREIEAEIDKRINDPERDVYEKNSLQSLKSSLPDDPTSNLELELFYRKEPLGALLEAYKIKDKMRALIFHHAKNWMDTSRLDSFVYPINHWKLSGGAIQEEHQREYAVYGESKLAKTFSSPDLLIVTADVHAEYFDKDRGGTLATDKEHFKRFFNIFSADETAEIRKSCEGMEHLLPVFNSPEVLEKVGILRTLLNTKIIRGALEYPGSENAAGKMQSVQKNLLEKFSREDAKIISLQVLFPSQKSDEKRFLNILKNINGKACNIMNAVGESYAEYSYITNADNAILTSIRKASEKIRGNPDWVQKFKDRIMLEPNYTFAGSELIDDKPHNETKEKLSKILSTIAEGCKELVDWQPKFDNPDILELIDRTKTECASFLKRYDHLVHSDSYDEEEYGKLINSAPELDVEEFRDLAMKNLSDKQMPLITDGLISKLGMNFKGGKPSVGTIAYKLNPAYWQKG